jgi:hypothetical protein
VTNTNGIGLLQTVSSGSTFQLTTPSVGGIATSAVGASPNYTAGTPNYTVLGQGGSNFKDPSTNGDYPVGVTTRGGGGFQVAARLEGGGVQKAEVQGSYAPRPLRTLLSATGATGNTITIQSADI